MLGGFALSTQARGLRPMLGSFALSTYARGLRPLDLCSGASPSRPRGFALSIHVRGLCPILRGFTLSTYARELRPLDPRSGALPYARELRPLDIRSRASLPSPHNPFKAPRRTPKKTHIYNIYTRYSYKASSVRCDALVCSLTITFGDNLLSDTIGCASASSIMVLHVNATTGGWRKCL
jgi:hypothetical protein